MTINNLQEANQALLPYVPLVSQLTGKDTTLDRIRPLMALLGNPQDKLRIVHIAGTSGKTSTAYYMAALLHATGAKIGLTVSPHVDSVTERVQIDGLPLSEAAFCNELTEFLALVQQAPAKPSYFELLYAFALWVFARQQVDYAVVETGLGGLHDATNIADRPDKVCIITDIGYDHMHILGNTLSEIAAQKIGIVHEHNEVFCYRQDGHVMAVFEQWIADHHASLHVINQTQAELNAPDVSFLAEYQRRNWLLAYEVFRHITKRDGLSNLTSQELIKTQHIHIPGRMDLRQIHGKTLIMDGAHNASKMIAFVDSFRQEYPDTKPAILVALKEGKDYQEVVPILEPLASQVIVTTFRTSQDLPARSIDPEKLAEAFNDTKNVRVIADQAKALQALIDAPEEVVIITGSFYLLSQIRRNTLLT